MFTDPYLLIAVAFFAIVVLCLVVVHAFARIEALERRVRHLHRKQDEVRSRRQAPTTGVSKVAR